MTVVRLDNHWWIMKDGLIVGGPFQTLQEAEEYLDSQENQS